ncbi:hypothetical protein MKX08_007932 [Trichoderma sp. CBMAI-0020]|nr:hypothetical protein MKX08_007932 [Trichoderma sp. CBMAI-0020]
MGRMRQIISTIAFSSDSLSPGQLIKTSRSLAEDFRHVANEEVKECIIRKKIEPDIHGFVMQGPDQIRLVHIPMFQMANHRWQLTITAEFPEHVKQRYQQLRKDNSGNSYTVANTQTQMLKDMIKPGI